MRARTHTVCDCEQAELSSHTGGEEETILVAAKTQLQLDAGDAHVPRDLQYWRDDVLPPGAAPAWLQGRRHAPGPPDGERGGGGREATLSGGAVRYCECGRVWGGEFRPRRLFGPAARMGIRSRQRWCWRGRCMTSVTFASFPSAPRGPRAREGSWRSAQKRQLAPPPLYHPNPQAGHEPRHTHRV